MAFFMCTTLTLPWERCSVQIKAVMKQKQIVMLGQMLLSMIECQNMTGTQHFATKGCATDVPRPELSS